MLLVFVQRNWTIGVKRRPIQSCLYLGRALLVKRKGKPTVHYHALLLIFEHIYLITFRILYVNYFLILFAFGLRFFLYQFGA